MQGQLRGAGTASEPAHMDVRFGSAEYAAEVLPAEAAAALMEAAAAVGQESALSVLVLSGQQYRRSGGDSVVRLFTFQVSQPR